MKLARPNLFNPRIVLAGCAQLPGGDGDDDGLVGALRKRGLHARWLPWDDPRTESADLVIVRAAGDYAACRGEFLDWSTRVRNLLNAPPVLAWNSDRHYLADLAAAGVPVLPPRSADPGGAGRRSGSQAAVTALVFLGGAQSHAVTRRRGRITLADPDVELWELGHGALDAAAAQLGVPRNEFLCARVDLTGSGDDAALRELNLIDPALGWHQLDPASRDLAQRSFALQVESALERLGLGSLSHRRP